MVSVMMAWLKNLKRWQQAAVVGGAILILGLLAAPFTGGGASFDCNDTTQSQEQWMKHCYDESDFNASDDQAGGSDVRASSSDDKVEVPNVMGMSKNDIQRATWLRQTGVTVSVMTAIGYEHSVSCQVQGMDAIIDQYPEPGQMVQRGTIVSAKDNC